MPTDQQIKAYRKACDLRNQLLQTIPFCATVKELIDTFWDQQGQDGYNPIPLARFQVNQLQILDKSIVKAIFWYIVSNVEVELDVELDVDVEQELVEEKENRRAYSSVTAEADDTDVEEEQENNQENYSDEDEVASQYSKDGVPGGHFGESERRIGRLKLIFDQLSRMDEKVRELDAIDPNSRILANNLVEALQGKCVDFILLTIDDRRFVSDSQAMITAARRSELAGHPGWRHLLINLALVISTLVIGYALVAACKGRLLLYKLADYANTDPVLEQLNTSFDEFEAPLSTL